MSGDDQIEKVRSGSDLKAASHREGRVELWERRELLGDDTHFRWMVWHPDGTAGGDCHWFTDDQEAEARALYGRLAEVEDLRHV